MKGKKIIVSALVASMVSAPVAVLGATSKALADNAPLTNEDASYTVVGPSVKVKNDFDREAKRGDIVKLPVVDKVAGKVVVRTVIDPNGNEVEVAQDATTFQPSIEGTYTYRIESYEEDGSHNRTSIVSTYDLHLVVTGDTGSIELPENSYYVIPTEFVKGKTLTVPVPTVFVNDEEVVFSSGDVAAVPGTTRYAVIKAFLTKSGVSEPIVMEYHEATGDRYDQLANFSYGFADSDTSIGTYKLTYKLYYVENQNTNVLEKEGDVYKYKPISVSNAKTIKVKSSLVSDKLYISWASTPKKSAEVGVKYNLVDVNATFTKGSTDYVDAFTKITVVHEGTNKEMVVDYNDMSFVPTEKGNYFVTYTSTIKSLGVESNILTYSILDVDDSTDPVLYLTGNYFIDADGKTYKDNTKTVALDDMEKRELLYTIGDTAHYVKSYYKLQPVEGTSEYAVTVKIPAAYVKDNYSNAKGIKVTRNLYKRTNTTESGKLQLINSVTESEYAFNEVAEYTFTTKKETGKTYYADGNYVVKYVYEDESGQSVTSDFNITVKAYSDETVKGEPKVTFNYDEEMIKSTDTVSFTEPTATDNYDTNLLVETYYGFVNPTITNNTFANVDKFTQFNYKDLENGKYTLDVAKAIKADKDNGGSDQTYLYLVSVAQNNYDSNLTLNKNVIVKKVLILGAKEDVVAPNYTTGFTASSFNTELVALNSHVVDYKKDAQGNPTDVLEQPVLGTNGYRTDDDKEGTTDGLFDQDDIVKIPTVRFFDADNFVNFDVKVSYKNGDEVVYLNALETGYSLDCIDHETVGDNQYEHVISGASFRASYAKTYTITISATDSNGNVSFTSFAVRVNDTQPPVISIENKAKFSTDIEVGTTFTVPAPTIYDNDEIDDDAEWSWSILAPNETVASKRTSFNRTYTPTVTGTYIITYTAKDGAKNVNTSSEYRLNVVAKEAPIITVAPIEETDRVWNYSATTQLPFEIPMASAKDKHFSDPIFVDAPVVKNSKGEERAVTKNAAGTMWQFTPDVQGTYTITYTAQGKFLNSTKQLTVNIGDGDAPTMVWDNKEEDFKATATIGDNWTFKFDMIDVEDNEDDLQSIIDTILKDGVSSSAMNELSDYVTITMKDADNKSVAYAIADGGLKYTFDKSGNYTFKMVLKDKAGNNSGNSYSYTITVNEKEEVEETTNDSAVGTILIVLSVVILAGVVAYFAITTKQVDSKSKSKKSDKKDEKADK